MALVGVALPASVSVAPQRLERHLRKQDFVAWLPSNQYVFLATDVTTDDVDGMRKRLVEALAKASGCDAIKFAVRVAVATADPDLTFEGLLQSALEGASG